MSMRPPLEKPPDGPAEADDRADRADEDQQLGQRQRVPRRLRALAHRHGSPCRQLGAGAARGRLLADGLRAAGESTGGGLPRSAESARPLARAPAPPRVALGHGGSLEATAGLALARHRRRCLAPMLADVHRFPPAARPRAAGIPDSALAGSVPGRASTRPRCARKLRSFAHVQLIGELVNLRRRARACTSSCATPPARCPARRGARTGRRCSRAAGGAPAEGMQVVVAGGCDYYPGSATSSPSFSFSVATCASRRGRPAGADRAAAPPARRGGAARAPEAAAAAAASAHDRRRHGRERQGARRRAARRWRGAAGRDAWCGRSRPCRIATRRRRSSARSATSPRLREVDVVIVARGGGSLADLLCFCDETLCRTVALLGVPVIASVGHHTDRTLLDDVAAVSCSTPTHAAEAAVAVDCRRARGAAAWLAAARATARRTGAARACLAPCCRAQLALLSRAPAAHLERQQTRLHQQLREIRAGSRRRVESERQLTERRALVLARKATPRVLRMPRAPPARAAAPRARARRARPAAHARARLRARADTATGRPSPTAADAARGGRAAAALRRRCACGANRRAMSAER